MRILISPAKQMIPDPDTLAPVSPARFLPEARASAGNPPAEV